MIGLAAVALPLSQIWFAPSDPVRNEAQTIEYNVRVLTMLWRVKHETETSLTKRLESEVRRDVRGSDDGPDGAPAGSARSATQTNRPAAGEATEATEDGKSSSARQATKRTASERRNLAERAARQRLARQAKDTLQQLKKAREIEERGVALLFDRATAVGRSANRAGTNEDGTAEDGTDDERAAKWRMRAQESVVAHCLATGRLKLAGELAAKLTKPSEPLLAALVAVEPAGARRKLTQMSLEQAADAVAGHKWGADLSRFTRDSIRARIYALAGQSGRAARLHRALNDQRDTIFAAFSTVCVIAGIAALIGALMWVVTLVRIRVAGMAGKPPLGWLTEQFGGLGVSRLYAHDPIVPLLGFGAWLLGFYVAALLLAQLPGRGAPTGLAALFQGLAGLGVTWAVIGAFSRTYPPYLAAKIIPNDDVESPWSASTAALRAFCVMLPVVAGAMLVTTLAIGSDGEPHPVAQLLLSDPSPLTLATLGIAVVIVAPIGEELFFRGFLHQTLRQHIGPRLAAIATALVFAAVHASPSHFAVLAVLGLTFSLVFEWVGSLWASIFLHSMWNACVYVFILCVAFS